VPRAVPGRVRLTGRSPLDGGWLGGFCAREVVASDSVPPQSQHLRAHHGDDLGRTGQGAWRWLVPGCGCGWWGAGVAGSVRRSPNLSVWVMWGC
jgi:hypothetical protein